MTSSFDLPLIRRARGYRLYGMNDVRYIDFFQNGGRAILGHKPGRLVHDLKNLLEKGVIGEHPSVYTHRLQKAVGKLLPSFSGFRVYEHEAAARIALESAGLLRRGEAPGDPLYPAEEEREGERRPRVYLWRPFLDDEQEGPDSAPAVVLPVLPFPARFVPAVVCFTGIAESRLPPSGLCSPLLLGGLTRTVYDLISNILSRDRTCWDAFDFPFWYRRGPYLLPRNGGPEEYADMFRAFLENGILLNPDPSCASIIPGEYTPGEIKYIKKWEHDYGA